MKNKSLKVILTFVLLVLTLNLISLKAYADPSASKGFAGYDDVTAEIKANEEIKNQEIYESEKETETVQSSNNFLETLEINGYELTPEFDKQTINYEIEQIDVEQVEVTAIAEDSRAKISGTGKIALNSGENDVKVEVTAENGAVRTYHIKVNKKENSEISNNNQENAIVNEENKDNSKNTITYIIIAILAIVIIIILVKNQIKKK